MDIIKYYYYDADFTNLKNNLKAKIADEIEIELKGPKSSSQDIKKESIGLFIDCSNINNPGEYFLEVNIKKLKDFNILSIKPDKVRVIVSKK